jgi:hypothetical protein
MWTLRQHLPWHRQFHDLDTMCCGSHSTWKKSIHLQCVPHPISTIALDCLFLFTVTMSINWYPTCTLIPTTLLLDHCGGCMDASPTLPDCSSCPFSSPNDAGNVWYYICHLFFCEEKEGSRQQNHGCDRHQIQMWHKQMWQKQEHRSPAGHWFMQPY